MWYNRIVAVVAQLVEQLIRNEQVAGSSPVNGSIFVHWGIMPLALVGLRGVMSWADRPIFVFKVLKYVFKV